MLGLRAGYLLGVLEGLDAALGGDGRKGIGEGEGKREIGERGIEVRKMVEEARRELVVERVFGREWWGEDGVWRFEVEGEGVTFERVVECHPVLRRWGGRVAGVMGLLGLGEGRFEGGEWERGRGVGGNGE